MHDIAMKKEKDQINKLLGSKSLKGRKTNENSGTGEYQPEDELMSEKVFSSDFNFVNRSL
jgi:hypothetical protein